jgi:hypothetical protein
MDMSGGKKSPTKAKKATRPKKPVSGHDRETWGIFDRMLKQAVRLKK